MAQTFVRCTQLRVFVHMQWIFKKVVTKKYSLTVGIKDVGTVPPHFRFWYGMVPGPCPGPSWSSHPSDFLGFSKIKQKTSDLGDFLPLKKDTSNADISALRAIHIFGFRFNEFVKTQRLTRNLTFRKKYRIPRPNWRVAIVSDVLNRIDEYRVFGVVEPMRDARSLGRLFRRNIVCTNSNGDKSVCLVTRTQWTRQGKRDD